MQGRRPDILPEELPIHRDFFQLVAVSAVVMSAFLRVGFWFVDESQGLVRRRQRTEEERAGVERATRERLEDSDEAQLQ